MKTIARLSLVIVTVVALVLTSCGPKPAPTPTPTKAPVAPTTEKPTEPPPSEDVTITIASCCYPEIHHKNAYDCMIEEFEKEYPHIKVVINGTPYAEFWDKLTVEIASETEEDILEIQGTSWLYTYGAMRDGEAGVWLNLDPYVEGTDFADTIMFFDMNKYNGHIVGIPHVWGVRAVFYNKDVLDMAAVDPESIKTWEDLREAAKKCTMDTDDDGVIDYYGFGVIDSLHSFTYSEWRTVLPDQTSSGGFWFPDGNCGPYTVERLQVNHPANVWAAKEWQSMIFDDKVGPPGDQDKKLEREIFWTGKVALHVDGPWFCGSTSVLHPELLDSMGTIPCPTVADPLLSGDPQKPRQTPYSGVVMCPTARTEHPEEVWTFLKWMAESPVAAQCAGICGMVPSNIPYASSEEYSEEWAVNAPFTKFMAEDYGPTQCTIDLPCFGEMEKAANVAAQAMYINGEDPQTVLDNLQEECKKIMEEYFASQ